MHRKRGYWGQRDGMVQKILHTQALGGKQLWVQISSIPFTNPVILKVQFPLSFCICEMGIIIPSQKVDSRVAGIQIGTQWVVRRD